MGNEMTLAEAASKLNPPVSKQTLDYHLRKGHITTRKSGRIHLVDLDVLQKELAEHAAKNANKGYSRKLGVKGPEENKALPEPTEAK